MLDIIILLVTVLGLACVRASIIVWTLIMSLVLLLVTIFGSAGFIILGISWLLFLAAALFANLKNIRQKYFTKSFIKTLQKRMPSISQTEREAIEAGNVWWEKDLFCGRPQWKKFLNMPKPTLSKEEQAFLNN